MRRPSLSDERLRHPLLHDEGRALLSFMQEHPHAPQWNYACGDQLDADGLAAVRAFGRQPAASWRPDELPVWLQAWVARVLAEVPFYRRGDAAAVTAIERFRMLGFTDRDDLRREAPAFVPDDQPLDGMMVYDTSGTSGSSLQVMADAVTSSSYLPLLERALAIHGVSLTSGRGRVSIVLVGAQQQTLTYATVSSYLDGAGFVKLNLHPSQWRSPDDRATYLDALQAEVYSGDPLAFDALAALDLKTRPKALVSTAMALLPATRARLEARFGCPVLDLYSLTECRLVAVGTPLGHKLLRPDIYIEAVDEEGRVCAPGIRGELIISGGNNRFLPLLRYRTGDHGALRYAPDGIYIEGLEGRSPVTFTLENGRVLNNIDVTNALRALPLTRFALHQGADNAFAFRWSGACDTAELERALRAVLGDEARVTVTRDDTLEGKWIQYTRDGTHA